MKRIRILCLILATFTCFTCGCIKKQPYKFLYDVTEIEQISIVYMTNANQVDNDYETIVVIEDKDEFLGEFNKILFNKFLLGDPTHIHNNVKVILIEYNNGDYEFIDYYAQDRFKNNECYFGRVTMREFLSN